jgi:hypothetical protein
MAETAPHGDDRRLDEDRLRLAEGGGEVECLAASCDDYRWRGHPVRARSLS